ncbi:OmpA family protein [Mangrovimonas aestuarii]|uniref:OmpA family protein n=1 Tax=Mangrovimonas aestuarii TaxID=3018443 RepID=UPI002378C80C|nr:OmpA family protein [Mangrovimonas aestuarii]
MKKLISISLALALVASISGCDAIKNANKTQKGAGLGAAGGALVGGLIGGNIKGALIGAAIGGAAGGIIGNQMDKQADKIEEAIPGAEVDRVGEGIQVYFDEKSGVTFATNKATLTDQAKQNLDAVADVFNEFPDTNLMVEGHTDDTGAEDYNMKLSKQRAQSVVDYLISKGVSSGRFTVQAFGETKPRFDNSTDEGRSKNRRVEIGISANEEMIEDAKAQAN